MTEPVARENSSATAAQQRRSRRLFGFGVVMLIALVSYYALTSQVEDPLHLYEGLGMVVLAVLPCLQWARRSGRHLQLPVFEIFVLTTINTYALPLLNDRADLRAYSPELVTQCGLVVLLFQVMIIATHSFIRGRVGRSPFFTQEVLTNQMQKYISYGLVLSTVYTYINTFYEGLIPFEINGVMRAVFSGIGLVVTFIQARRWGQGQLNSNERAFFATLFIAQVIINFSTLFLVGGISAILIGLIGYIAGSQRLPLVTTGVLLVIIALLHNGKNAMRAQYWDENGDHQQVPPTELVPFFTQWISEGLAFHEKAGEQQMTKNLIDRSSLFQILCLVAYYTPDRQPYLDGDTYWDIPGQFVPRPFWPEKPVGHISTYKLAMYYGLQSQEDTYKTTIGFGMIAEAYANFGFFGVGLLAFVLGAFYKLIEVRTSNSPLLSYAGLFLIILMAWSFQTEWPMSLWLSSMAQSAAAILGLPFLIRHFLS
ncbi:MAG TPA: O-antigen polymerase [Opitutaceae bacterium]|nr:O-antigen polymerase [Opitutaceae bacterium]